MIVYNFTWERGEDNGEPRRKCGRNGLMCRSF